MPEDGSVAAVVMSRHVAGCCRLGLWLAGSVLHERALQNVDVIMLQAAG